MYNPVLSMYARVSISYKHCMSGIYYPRTSTQGRISMDSLVSVANGHPWIIPGQVQYPPSPFRVSADALVCQAIHGWSSPDKCNTPPPPFRVSADALVCQAIHGSSLDKCNTPTPPFRVSADALVCRAIHGSSPDKCNTTPPPFQSIRGCPSMSGHPWIIPGQVQYPPPPFRVSADALVCQAIHGSSPDKCNTPPPFQSIHGCPSMSGHPWIIPGQVQYPPSPFRVSADALVCRANHGSSPDKCNTPPPFRVSTDALVCRAIHGSSPDKCNTPPPLSEYPRMP